jgi:tetratricopeptide (TPR) repeat protein
VERYRAGSENHLGAVVLSVQLATLMNQDSIALAMASQMRNSKDNQFLAEIGATILRGLLRRAGRLRESWETARFEEAASAGRTVSARGFGLLYEAIDRGLFLDDVSGARRLLDEAERRFPQESLPPRERYTDDFMMAAYHAQRPDLLRRMVESLKRHDPQRPAPGGGSNMLAQAEAFLALLEGRKADAIAAVHRSDVGPQPKSSLVRVASVLDRAGQPDSAMHYYERYFRSTSIDLTVWSEALNLALARRRLAQLYDERQEYTKAYEMYAAFAHQWRDADPELQPLVRNARARMSALERLRAQ